MNAYLKALGWGWAAASVEYRLSGEAPFPAAVLDYSEATKKSRQKMYEEAAAGNPEAQARYENFLAAKRENYHKKKQDEKGEQIA